MAVAYYESSDGEMMWGTLPGNTEISATMLEEVKNPESEIAGVRGYIAQVLRNFAAIVEGDRNA